MNLQIVPVRQQVATDRVTDVAAEVRAGLRRLGLETRVRPGMRIAVAVGSRGISCLPEVVRTTLQELQALHVEAFLVPAMGSHGGGTAEGQREVLEGYGLGPKTLGVPILSSMEAIQIGVTPEGMDVYFDRHVAGADGVIVINRIKEHTAFRGSVESGLCKILAVGLGKARGAAEIHNWDVRDAMPATARFILAHMPVLGGIGIVENGNHEPARIAVLPADRFEQDEPVLLDLARRLAPKIPLEPLDLLVIQEMGKDISGTGMDLNVIGMWRRTGGPVSPQFRTIATLDLTVNSHGNAIGVGHADLIPERLRAKIDVAATYIHCLTSHNLAGAKLPITLPNDRAVIEAGLTGVSTDRARLVWVKNTLTLGTLWVSEPLLEAVHAHPLLETIGPARPLAFDADGALIPPSLD